MALKPFSEQQLKPSIQPAKLSEDWDDIIRQCKITLAKREVSIDSKVACYSLLGKAFVKQGKDEAAIAAYTKSIQQAPERSESHYALGILYDRQQKAARAICHYQRAIQLQPDWVQVIFKLGRLFHRLGCSLRALEAYERALEIDPNYAEAHVAVGFIYEQRSEPRLAIKHYQKAAYLQPKYAEARRRVGRILTKLEAYDAAIDVYHHALKALPEDARTYSSLAYVLQLKGDSQRAVEAYQKAITLDNSLATVHQNFGRLRRVYQDLDGASEQFQQALRQLPDSQAILSDYAEVLLVKGEWTELLDSFRLAISHQPDWISDYCKRTVQLSEQDLLFRVQRTCGRFLMALQQAKSEEMTVILKERLGQIYEYLGDLSVACDSPDRAEQYYRTALALTPYAFKLYLSLGECIMSQGRQPAAIAIYQAGILQGEQRDEQRDEQPPDNAQVASADHLFVLKRRYEQALAQQATTTLQTTAQPAASNQEKSIAGIYPTVDSWQKEQARVSENAASDDNSVSDTYALETASETVSDSSNHQPSCEIRTAQADSSCGGITCQRCMSGLIQQFSPVQVGKQSFHCKASTADIPDPPTFSVTIPAGRAWVAPQKNAWDVCNEVGVITPDGFLLGDLSRSYPWYLPGCERHHLSDHTLLKRKTPLPPARYLPGNVALLSSLSGHIYYHWMFDVLPRVDILKRSLSEQNKTLDDIDFFVVNNFEKDFQKETLSTLGIPLEKVIASDRVPHINAENLVVPSFPGHLDWVPTRSLSFLRETFLERDDGSFRARAEEPHSYSRDNFSEKGKRPGIKSKRIYISRKGAKYRQIFNESVVTDMLAQFGFVSTALETLTVAEQARLFADAEIIVAPHGSGLANLAFCSPGTTVIECFSPHYVRTDYWMISDCLQLNHYYLIGESFNCRPLRQLMYPSGLTEDFSVDIKELRSLLRTAGIDT